MDIDELRRHNGRILASGYPSLSAFGEAIDRSPVQISQLLGSNPRKNIGRKIARHIEKCLGLPVGWLDQEHDEQEEMRAAGMLEDGVPLSRPAMDPSAGKADSLRLQLIPMLDWSEPEQFVRSPNGPIREQATLLPCPVGASEKTYALRVKGDSMTSPYPTRLSFIDGSLIYVDPDRAPVSGKPVIARMPDTGEHVFKLYVEDAGSILLKPINPQYPTIPLPSNAIICGVVIGQFIEI